MKLVYRFNLFVFSILFSNLVLAGTNIGSPKTGFFSQIGGWLQAFVDFLEGPWGLFITIAGLAFALTIWVIGTRSGEGLGMFGRVVIASILLINIPALVIALQAF